MKFKTKWKKLMELPEKVDHIKNVVDEIYSDVQYLKSRESERIESQKKDSTKVRHLTDEELWKREQKKKKENKEPIFLGRD